MTIREPLQGIDRLLRQLPAVQRLMESDEAQEHCVTYGRSAVISSVRRVLDVTREQVQAGSLTTVPTHAALLAHVRERLSERHESKLHHVINATGVILHTNLGRAPLAREALDAVASVASGYSNLEFDLEHGRRGSRTAAIETLLRELTGVEAALAVNNGAAAILLAISALAAGGEVIVSRGELVEIGGGFRIPDVIAQGRARLVEVGATNMTRAGDYRTAIGPDTRVLLKIHQSNFRTIGFASETGLAELASISKAYGLLLIADLGSGLLAATTSITEPPISKAFNDGADLITCSGDKLLGGPQAGLILGTRAAVEPLSSHPLLRAVRLDKMSLAALEATLILHRHTPERVPVWRMLSQSETVLEQRALRLIGIVGSGEIVATDGFAGGGALPEQRLPSRAVAFWSARGVELAARMLRRGSPPVVARIADGRLLVDMLTVADQEIPALAAALQAVRQ